MSVAPLLCALLASAQAGPHDQRIVLNAAFEDVVPESVVATVEQSRAVREVVLVDDGSSFEDAPGDRVWTGAVVGDLSQYVRISVSATVGGVATEVYTGAIRVGNAPTVEIAVGVYTHADGRLVGARQTSASRGRLTHALQAVPTLAASFWAVLVLTLGAIALQARAARRAAGGGDEG